MYLDYSKLDFDKDGIPETPEIELRTLDDLLYTLPIGIIPGVFNLKFNIKFSEPSEISFDVPAVIDGVKNPLYDDITGYKQLYTKRYGIYVTMNPTTEDDGICAIKHVHGYSYEKTLESKKFFLEEGTFNFWNPIYPFDGVLGRIQELAVGWKIGYVSPTLIGRYRTFDQYDDYLLSFIYNTAPEKFRCVFVFDTYKRTINVYDADEERPSLPIYLDFDNLLKAVDIEELSDELVTAIRPYGADGLDIRAVNPIGTNWIYDISHFINNGDIPLYLAKKWETWQQEILNHQPYYRGLSGLQASRTAQLLTEQAVLTDLKGELDTLAAQQSVTIQALAMEKTDTGKASQQKTLDDINRQIYTKKAEIASKEASITSIKWDLDPKNPDSYTAQIKAVTDSLAIKNYFRETEYEKLSHYFIEQDITENSFVATSVDTNISGEFGEIVSSPISISNSNVSMVNLPNNKDKRLYLISGGKIYVYTDTSGGKSLTADIVRGTLEAKSNRDFILSLYVGDSTINSEHRTSGMITIVGKYSRLTSPADSGDNSGTWISISIGGEMPASLYITSNVSDYQKYAVQMELYDYAVNVLHDLATPTYEFSVDSGNFLFAQEFSPFRNNLELGKGIYLNVSNGLVITPYIIEFELDFEDRSKFSILFSNRFKRHDCVNTLKDMLERSYSTSRNFDASKYIYNQTVGQASMVSKFMSDSLDAAKNTILAASNQSVIINGAGINVGGDSKYQLRIVDSMIAMTDDNWSTAKLAIGRFASPEVGEYWGVNAEVIGGKLVVGNNLIIENENDHGVMQFKVDSSGAWLYNSTFTLAQDGGGKILIDPKYGIAAGTGSLYSTNGTTVYPSFIGRNGSIIKDSEGMPVNSNFFLDLRDGTAYFRGTVYAKNGTFSGKLEAATGKFNGTVQADRFLDSNGRDMMSAGKFKSDYLDLRGITIWDSGGNKSFEVARNGDVTIGGTINGTIHMGAGSSIDWGSVTNKSTYLAPGYSEAIQARIDAAAAISTTNSFGSRIERIDKDVSDAKYLAQKAQQLGQEAIEEAMNRSVSQREVFNALTNNGANEGLFSTENGELYINASYINSGTINADLITFETDGGGFRVGPGLDAHGNRTFGPMIFSNSRYYLIVTNAGIRLQTPDNWLTVTNSGVWVTGAMVHQSDQNLKNTILYDMDRYESFFMDLKPTQFRYNDGSSGRFHTGFISQDVEQALTNNGLSTKDFAGFVLSGDGDGDPRGVSGNHYYLRYTEFISLNTYMIQKAHKRIKELENKIRVLEEALH